MIFLRTNWPNFVYKVTFYSMSADLQYQRSGCEQQYLPERRSGSKIFATTTPPADDGQTTDGHNTVA